MSGKTMTGISCTTTAAQEDAMTADQIGNALTVAVLSMFCAGTLLGYWLGHAHGRLAEIGKPTLKVVMERANEIGAEPVTGEEAVRLRANSPGAS